MSTQNATVRPGDPLTTLESRLSPCAPRCAPIEAISERTRHLYTLRKNGFAYAYGSTVVYEFAEGGQVLSVRIEAPSAPASTWSVTEVRPNSQSPVTRPYLHASISQLMAQLSTGGIYGKNPALHVPHTDVDDLPRVRWESQDRPYLIYRQQANRWRVVDALNHTLVSVVNAHYAQRLVSIVVDSAEPQPDPTTLANILSDSDARNFDYQPLSGLFDHPKV